MYFSIFNLKVTSSLLMRVGSLGATVKSLNLQPMSYSSRVITCFTDIFRKDTLKMDSGVGWPINFKCFTVIFSLKKENYPISAFVQFSTEKNPKVVNLPLADETLCLSLWCHKQDKWLFQFSKLSWGTYVSL